MYGENCPFEFTVIEMPDRPVASEKDHRVEKLPAGGFAASMQVIMIVTPVGPLASEDPTGTP